MEIEVEDAEEAEVMITGEEVIDQEEAVDVETVEIVETVETVVIVETAETDEELDQHQVKLQKKICELSLNEHHILTMQKSLNLLLNATVLSQPAGLLYLRINTVIFSLSNFV